MGGDDALIKRMKGYLYVLVFLLIGFIFAFGIVQFLPRSRVNQTCSYVIHPLIANHFIRINWPELPRQCHG